MTEEEYFRKYYPDFCYGDKPLSPHWDFFQEGVEFGERESEEQIAELKEKLERAERARDYWKDSSFDWRHKCTSRRPFRVAVKAQKQLTKAKELLTRFVMASVYFNGKEKDLVEEAEQFLKEE